MFRIKVDTCREGGIPKDVLSTLSELRTMNAIARLGSQILSSTETIPSGSYMIHTNGTAFVGLKICDSKRSHSYNQLLSFLPS